MTRSRRLPAAPPNVRPSLSVPVWDRAVRALHWALVAAVALAALSTVAIFGAHRPAGYAALAIVALRALWGGCGGRYARFAQCVRGPVSTGRYLRRVLRRCEPRHLGHNPLGAWMAIALMLCVAALGLTGGLYTTDAFWGDAGVEALHRGLAWTLLALVLLHLGGVIYTSLRHRENLVTSMFSGTKRAPRGDDID